MVKTRRKGKNKCGGKSRKPRFNMRGCASKRHQHYIGGSEPIAPLSIAEMNNFKGGSTCPSCNTPTSFPRILGSYQNGGCGTCGTGMTGGSSTLQPVPAPFVGEPWGGKVSQWPGVDGVDSGRNYFANNLYNHGDPQTMMKLYDWGGKGGSRRRHRRSKGHCCSCNGVCSSACKCKGKCTSKCRCGCHKKVLKGGSFLPDVVGLGRDLTYNFESMFNSLNGYDAPVNPKPYVQPALSSSNLSTKY